jgi:hypothetical protein
MPLLSQTAARVPAGNSSLLKSARTGDRAIPSHPTGTLRTLGRGPHVPLPDNHEGDTGYSQLSLRG